MANTRPVNFTVDGAARIVRAVESIERWGIRSIKGGQGASQPDEPFFWAVTTSVYNATTKYTFKRQHYSGTAWVDDTTAINYLVDANGGTWYPVGTRLLVYFSGYDGTGNSTYQGNLINGNAVRVCWATNLAGGGKYTGKLIIPPAADLAATGDLATGDLGTVGADCLVVNSCERARPTHFWADWAHSGTKDLWVQGTIIHTQAAGTYIGWPVVQIDLPIPAPTAIGQTIVSEVATDWIAGVRKLGA